MQIPRFLGGRFSTFNISCHALLAYKAAAEESADGLMGFSLYITHFLLASFNIISLSLAFAVFIEMCLGVSLLGFFLFGALYDSGTWVSVCFLRLGKFLAIISPNILFASFSPLLF